MDQKSGWREDTELACGMPKDQGEDRGGALAETGRGGEAGPRAGAPRGSGQAGGEGSPDVWDLIFLQEVGRKQ